jgi:hypothetical protein
MTTITKRNQIFSRILSALRSVSLVMHFKILPGSTPLTSPSISLQNLIPKPLILFNVG